MSSRTLDSKQVGHLRHWDNISRQPKNDWTFMQGKGIGQDDFGGYRFQLAFMIYGLGLTHRHRLPAAPGLFKPTIQRLITKLLEPEVWMYWRDASRGGMAANAHLSDELREEWDPIARDNIMYSAYVQSTSLLHDYLFADDRYAQPGSLTVKHWSFFFGGEERKFEYDRESLNDLVYWQMVQNGYLGVACEPNCVFQICNQPAILGFRLHDLITGGNRAREVVDGYEAAWKEFGRLDSTGHYNSFITEDSKTLVPSLGAWSDAWLGMLMNMWNRDFVRKHYPVQVGAHLVDGGDGTKSIDYIPMSGPLGEADPYQYDVPDFGAVAAWAAEMGDGDTLAALLQHADRYMEPSWLKGGLYYPRNDELTDSEGKRTIIEPLTGNVLLGYARLNSPDGLWRLYNEPWGEDHFKEPAIVALERNIDVTRAEVLDGTLHATVTNRSDLPGGGTITIGRLPLDWRLRVDGREISTETETCRVVDNEIVLTVPDDGASHDVTLGAEL